MPIIGEDKFAQILKENGANLDKFLPKECPMEVEVKEVEVPEEEPGNPTSESVFTTKYAPRRV